MKASGGRRKDTGVELVRRGQTGDLGGAGHAEPAHGSAPAPRLVPGGKAAVSAFHGSRALCPRNNEVTDVCVSWNNRIL